MSEEMKNLNDQQPEEVKAPVEEKTEAPKLPFNLSKKTLAIICGAVAAALVLVLVLVLTLGGGNDPHTHSFENGKCACGESDPNYVPPHTHSFVEGKCECGETDPNYVPEGPAVTEKEYTLGMGLVFGDLTNAQIDATIATVVLDSNGVIVDCKIDAVQNKYKIEDTIVFSNLLTKKELGFDYHMAAYGKDQDRNGDGIVKEWFEQAEAFEAWCVGKTIAEVEAMETQTQADGYVIPADEALLAAGCTIQITDFVDAVVKAGNDDQAMTFTTEGEMVLGLGVNNSDNGSTGDDFEATVNMNIDFAAVVTVDGVIVAALNDAAQPKVVIEDGSVISTSVGKGEGILKTKRELKEAYGMAGKVDNNGDGIKLEWYIQSEAFSKYIVGKTPAQVAKLETALVGGHYISTDEVLLNAGCTIQITGIMDVVAEAADYTPSYTLGMGLVFGDLNNTQINATIATVVLDENGVIVAVKIDAVQNKYKIEDTIVFSNLLTKKELGFDYHMAAYGKDQDRNGDGIVKEWFEQAEAFEAWCVGKTIAEVEAMETQTQADGYVIPADEALLAAGCTIQITDFVDAVVKAGNDDQAMTFTTEGEMVLGLGVNNSDNGSTGDDFEATVNMNIDFAAVVTVDGVIVAALNDAAQPKVVIEDGSVISTSVGKGEGILKTKRELKEAYGMAGKVDNNGDGIKLEWYIQSEAFSKYIVGMTAEQVENLETALVGGHYISTDEVLLNAGCTIQITGIMDVVVEACGEAA